MCDAAELAEIQRMRSAVETIHAMLKPTDPLRYYTAYALLPPTPKPRTPEK